LLLPWLLWLVLLRGAVLRPAARCPWPTGRSAPRG